MAKDPAFLFYASDFLTGTMFFSNEQVGKYIRLLCSQHQHGGLIERAAFDSIVGSDAVLRAKFEETEQGYYNIRLSVEMELRNKKSANISDAAKETWKKRKERNTIVLQSHKDSNTAVIRLEDENEDENEDEVKDDSKRERKKSEKEILFSEIVKNLSGNGKSQDEIKTLATATVEEDFRQFTRLSEWIENNCPRVADMKEPITLRQFVKIREEIKDKAKITELLRNMQNWQPLLKKNVSAYQTLLNWAKREQ